MATLSEVLTKNYRPGDTVDCSGVYRVNHEPAHERPHDVTVVAGKSFPACRSCAQPHFKAERLAQHIEDHVHFNA